MEARRAKGLCFNCDEKFHRGHRCGPKQFLLLLCDDPFAMLPETLPPPEEAPPPLPPLPTNLIRGGPLDTNSGTVQLTLFSISQMLLVMVIWGLKHYA
jgi:hypothetical protein